MWIYDYDTGDYRMKFWDWIHQKNRKLDWLLIGFSRQELDDFRNHAPDSLRRRVEEAYERAKARCRLCRGTGRFFDIQVIPETFRLLALPIFGWWMLVFVVKYWKQDERLRQVFQSRKDCRGCNGTGSRA